MSEEQRPHTGSHPLTETTCDDLNCWCRDSRRWFEQADSAGRYPNQQAWTPTSGAPPRLNFHMPTVAETLARSILAAQPSAMERGDWRETVKKLCEEAFKFTDRELGYHRDQIFGRIELEVTPKIYAICPECLEKRQVKP